MSTATVTASPSMLRRILHLRKPTPKQLAISLSIDAVVTVAGFLITGHWI